MLILRMLICITSVLSFILIIRTLSAAQGDISISALRIDSTKADYYLVLG